MDMRQILLICAVMLLGCQRLRLEVDDLRLRCGEDASLDYYEQWIEVATDYGKPSPSSINAAMIQENLLAQELPISSRGCIGRPKNMSGYHWLSVRVEQGGVFGKVVRLDEQVPWRLQLSRIPGTTPRVDCAKQEVVGTLNGSDSYSFSIKLPDGADRDNYHFAVKAFDQGTSAPVQDGFSLVNAERNAAQLNLQGLKEGQYQIEFQIHDLLNFQAGVKSTARKCPVTIDRTAPLIQLVDRNGRPWSEKILKAAPGEAIEFKVDDQTNVQVFTCLMQSQRDGNSCRDFTESGKKITAPTEGEWMLAIYSMDGAGNRSSTQEFKLAVFDSEKLRAIAGWLEEAKLYINQKDYLQSVYRLTKALQGFEKLKAEAEKSSIRAKLIAPLLQVLNKNVPFARFGSGGVNIDAAFPLESDRIAIVSGSIFQAGESELQLMRTNGEVIKKLNFKEKVSIFHNAIDRRLLIVHTGGSYEVLDSSLRIIQEGANSEFPVDYFGRMPNVSYVAGRSSIYTYNNATYALDLVNAEVTKITDGIAGIAMANSGEWASLSMGQEHLIYNRKTRTAKPLKIGFDVKKTALAQKTDFICYMGSKELLCGSLPELYEGKVLLQNELAGKAFGISSDANKIAYAGAEGIYLLDRRAGTHLKKFFQGPVIQIFFDQVDTMLADTIIGRRSWDDLYDGMDGSSTDQLPALTRDQYWFSRTDIFVKKFGKMAEFYFPDVQGQIRKISLDIDLAKAQGVIQSLDRKFLIVVNQKEIEVISLNVQLGDGFKQPCNRISFDGDYCALVGSGNLKIGRKVSSKGYLDYEMVEVRHSSVWREIVWNDVQTNRFVVWNFDEIGIGKMQGGRAVIEKRLPAVNLLTVRWLGGRYIAWVDDTLKIYDTVRGDFIGDFSGRSVQTLFNPPVDYSPELSVMAAVTPGVEGDLELKLLRPHDGAEVGRWKFKEKGKEEADLVKFSEDGLTLLLGFHDGTVQILESAQIQKKNFEPKVIAQHADSVMGGDFMKADRTAFTLSMDGAVIFHSDTQKEAPVFQGSATYPADDSILYTGVVRSENLIWVSDQGGLQIFDPARRHYDEVFGGKAYFRNNFLLAYRNQEESYMIDIIKLNYLKTLCDWLMPSLKFGIFKNEESSPACL
jgi:hypothetical protein